MGAACFSVVIHCGNGDLPLASGLESVACTPSTNACRRTDNRKSLIHLRYPAGLLVGGRVQPSCDQKHGPANSPAKEAANRAKNTKAQ
jgi:hypothetical protein